MVSRYFRFCQRLAILLLICQGLANPAAAAENITTNEDGLVYWDFEGDPVPGWKAYYAGSEWRDVWDETNVFYLAEKQDWLDLAFAIHERCAAVFFAAPDANYDGWDDDKRPYFNVYPYRTPESFLDWPLVLSNYFGIFLEEDTDWRYQGTDTIPAKEFDLHFDRRKAWDAMVNAACRAANWYVVDGLSVAGHLRRELPLYDGDRFELVPRHFYQGLQENYTTRDLRKTNDTGYYYMPYPPAQSVWNLCTNPAYGFATNYGDGYTAGGFLAAPSNNVLFATLRTTGSNATDAIIKQEPLHLGMFTHEPLSFRSTTNGKLRIIGQAITNALPDYAIKLTNDPLDRDYRYIIPDSAYSLDAIYPLVTATDTLSIVTGITNNFPTSKYTFTRITNATWLDARSNATVWAHYPAATKYGTKSADMEGYYTPDYVAPDWADLQRLRAFVQNLKALTYNPILNVTNEYSIVANYANWDNLGGWSYWELEAMIGIEEAWPSDRLYAPIWNTKTNGTIGLYAVPTGPAYGNHPYPEAPCDPTFYVGGAKNSVIFENYDDGGQNVIWQSNDQMPTCEEPMVDCEDIQCWPWFDYDFIEDKFVCDGDCVTLGESKMRHFDKFLETKINMGNMEGETVQVRGSLGSILIARMRITEDDGGEYFGGWGEFTKDAVTVRGHASTTYLTTTNPAIYGTNNMPTNSTLLGDVLYTTSSHPTNDLLPTLWVITQDDPQLYFYRSDYYINPEDKWGRNPTNVFPEGRAAFRSGATQAEGVWRSLNWTNWVGSQQQEYTSWFLSHDELPHLDTKSFVDSLYDDTSWATTNSTYTTNSNSQGEYIITNHVINAIADVNMSAVGVIHPNFCFR